MIKATVYYSGGRNSVLEQQILTLAESCNGNKGGEWGFSENGFQCLFLFRKEQHAQDFSQKSRQKINYRVIVSIGR